MSGNEINNNEAFAAAYERLPDDVKDRLSFKNTESYEDWQKRRGDAKPMATPWFNQGVTIMGPAGYFVAETQIYREHARVDTYLALANAEHIVKCVNAHDAVATERDTLQRDLAAANARNALLVGMLQECEEYFEDCADVIDGSYGEPAPNKEMAILSAIRFALSGAPK